MTVHHAPTMDGHQYDLVHFALKGWVDTVDEGHGWRRFMPFYPTDSAYYVFRDQRPASILVYRPLPELRTIHIQLGYTARGYRNQGIYRTLHEALVRHASTDYNTVTSLIHKDNHRMMDIARDRDNDFIYSRQRIN